MFTLRRKKSADQVQSMGVIDRHTAQAPWFRENGVPDLISQEVSDKPPGYFVIRRNGAEPNAFILTYRGTGGPVNSVQLAGTPEEVWISGTEKRFPTLLALVSFYSKPNDAIAGQLVPDAKTQKVMAKEESVKQKTLTKSLRMKIKGDQKRGTIKKLPGSKYKPGDVADLLINRGLGEYVPMIKKNKIDGVVFLSLDDQQLQELGVALPEHRKAIVTLVDMLMMQLDPERAKEVQEQRRREEEEKSKTVGLVAREIAGKLHFYDTDTNEEVFDIAAHQARKRKELAMKGLDPPSVAEPTPAPTQQYNEDFYGTADSVVPITPQQQQPVPQPQDDDMYTSLPQRSFVPPPVQDKAPPPLLPRGQSPAAAPAPAPAVPPPRQQQAQAPPPLPSRPPVSPPSTARERPPVPPPSTAGERSPPPLPTGERPRVPLPTQETPQQPSAQGRGLDALDGYGEIPDAAATTSTMSPRPPPALPPRPGADIATGAGYAQLGTVVAKEPEAYASLNPARNLPRLQSTGSAQDLALDSATTGAPWFVPRYNAAKAPQLLEGKPEGSFHITETGPSQMWLHYVASGGQPTAMCLRTEEATVSIPRSVNKFNTVFELVDFYSGGNSELPHLLMLPSEHVADHTKRQWYVDDLNKEAAHSLIEFERDGSFVIRRSKQFEGSFALSYVQQGVVHDTLLESTASGLRLANGTGEFYNDLLSFVEDATAAVLPGLPCKLVQPRPLHAVLETRFRRLRNREQQDEEGTIAMARAQSRKMSTGVPVAPWDLRTASRAEALDYLRRQPPGGFVVRSSESRFAALSIRGGNGQERHMHIERTSSGVYLKKHKQIFPDLNMLIAHYCEAERPELGVRLIP